MAPVRDELVDIYLHKLTNIGDSKNRTESLIIQS